MKLLEERIVSFTVEFVKAVAKIHKDLIYENYSVRYGKKKLMFENITLDKMTVKDCLLYIEDDQEKDVREFADDCVAYMMCEGYLYEKMYGYKEYREDIYGDGDEAEKLYHAAVRFAGKYRLRLEWGEGALIFYDNAYTAIHHLLRHEFYDGEKTECPIVVLGPAGRKTTKFRIYAYGGLIGRIPTGNGKTCLADTEYSKYLGELSRDDEIDKKYLRHMNEKYVRLEDSGTEYRESTVCDKLRERLKEILDAPYDFYLSSPSQSAEYLDLILKAVEKKFMNTGKALGERRIQTAIVRRHMKKDSEDGWCVVDMEYEISKNVNLSGKGFKPDIVVFDKNNGFGLIELKYDDKSTENLQKHYMDVQNVMNDNDIAKITDELKRRSAYLGEYGLISHTMYKSIKNSNTQNLWQGFLFVGGQREKAINLVSDLVKRHGEMIKDENCRFAFYPYKEENSIDQIKLDYQSMQTYEDFIKG